MDLATVTGIITMMTTLLNMPRGKLDLTWLNLTGLSYEFDFTEPA